MQNPCKKHPVTGRPCSLLPADKNNDDCAECIYRLAYVKSLDFGREVQVEFREGRAYIDGRPVALPKNREMTARDPKNSGRPLPPKELPCMFPGCREKVSRGEYCSYHSKIVWHRKYYGWPKEHWHDPVGRKGQRWAQL